jgi:membrane fusion protein (multidrug efflux system)
LALLLAVLLLAGVGPVLTGCNASSESEAAENSAEPDAERKDEAEEGKGEEDKEEAVPVEVTNLSTGEIESVLRYSTNLEAESHVEVHAQAARQVVNLLVEEGDRVKRGQVLIRLMDDEQRNNLALVRSELDKARREYERSQRLYRENLISEQQFNDVAYEIDQLEIRLENAQRELGYTEVRAPISGTITTRLVKLGDQITVGQHLFDIVDFDSIVARVYVPEKHLPELHKGLLARVSSPSLGERTYEGQVQRIAPVVDPRSGTVKLTVALGGQPGLRPGMYVDVDLVTASHQDVVLVPKQAVVYDNDKMFVFTLGEGNRANRMLLEAVLTDKLYIEPAGGLEAGDPIIVAGQTGLKDGTLVELPEQKQNEELADSEPSGTEETEDQPVDESDDKAMLASKTEERASR